MEADDHHMGDQGGATTAATTAAKRRASATAAHPQQWYAVQGQAARRRTRLRDVRAAVRSRSRRASGHWGTTTKRPLSSGAPLGDVQESRRRERVGGQAGLQALAVQGAR